MAEWRYFDGQDDEYSGCELLLQGFSLWVTPNVPPNGFMYWANLGELAFVVELNHAPTREQAQRAALDALITQLDEWKAQAEAARAELDDDERTTCNECDTDVLRDEYWQCPTCLKSMCLQCHEARACNGECDGCMLGEVVK